VSNEFEILAQAAAGALVSAMATDSWETAKRRFAAVFGRERQIDATHAELAAKSGRALARARETQEQAWNTRLRDVLDENPGAAPALQAVLAELARLGITSGPGNSSVSQRASHGANASHGSNAGNVGGNVGNISGNRDDVNVGVGQVNKYVDKRRRFFLAPFLSFGHSAATHPVVTTVVTLVVAAGGVTGGVALTHHPKHAAAPAPTVSTAPVPAHAGGSALGWTQLDYGPDRTGYQPDETQIGPSNVGKLTQARTYRVAGGGPSAPLVANGVLYVDSGTGMLYAFDATGAGHCPAAGCTPLWTARTPGTGSVAIGDGDIFVAESYGVAAFSAAGTANCSGTPKVCTPLWTTSTNIATGPGFTPGRGSPVVAGGVLYVPGGGGASPSTGQALVAAFDAAGKTGCSGTPVICVPMWTTTGPPSSSGSPAVANGVLYIADGTLYAFDAAGSANCTGTPRACAPLWTAPVSTRVTAGAPAVADGLVYVGSGNGGLYAFDATGAANCSAGAAGKTCAPLWYAPDGSGGTPAVANGVVYTVSAAGTLSAFDATRPTDCPGTGTVKTCTRAPLWTSGPGPSGYVTSSSPAVANGVVYFSSTNGGTYGYDAAGSLKCSVSGTAKTCAPLWGATTGFIGGGSPAVVDGVVYINVSGDGTVYAYSL